MIRRIKNFLRCQSGATAIEYSLVAGMIALVIIAAVTQLGSGLLTFFQEVAEAI